MNEFLHHDLKYPHTSVMKSPTLILIVNILGFSEIFSTLRQGLVKYSL